jgi:hypothetical protein
MEGSYQYPDHTCTLLVMITLTDSWFAASQSRVFLPKVENKAENSVPLDLNRNLEHNHGSEVDRSLWN